MLHRLTQRSGFYLRSIGHRPFATSISSPLSQKDIDLFRNEGYCAVQKFFDMDEFRAIRAALIKLKNMGRLANVATAGDGITHTTSNQPQNLQLCPLSPELSLFKSLPFNKKICGAMAQLLHDDSFQNENIGDQDICSYLSQTFWKPALNGAGTGMHQDNAYFLTKKPQFGTAFWIPIHKATKENGTIQVVKGFRTAGDEYGTPLEHRRDGGSDHHVTCKDTIDTLPEQDIIELEVDEGGVAFFNFNVPHATGPNPTNQPRASVAFHFLNRKHFIERQFPLPEGTEYVTPIIVGPNCSDGEKEYGYKVGEQQWIMDMNDMLTHENEILEQEKYAQQYDVREVKQDRAAKETFHI